MPAMLLTKNGAKTDKPAWVDPRVVIVRDGTKTVLTMAGGVKGLSDKTELTWLIAVPPTVDVKHFNIGTAGLLAALDQYTAPRLVLTSDPDPCSDAQVSGARIIAVKDKTSFSDGDYDIKVLSVADSKRVAASLERQGFKLSSGDKTRIAAEIKRERIFAVVSITRLSESSMLKPVQVAYDDAQGDLPLTFGAGTMGASTLQLYVITRQGRGELKGFKTSRFPAGETVPARVQDNVTRVFEAIALHAVRDAKEPTARLEYAGDLGFCDPCAADAPTVDVLRKLGVFWLDGVSQPPKQSQRIKAAVADATGKAFVTRWQLSYDAKRLTKEPALTVSDDKNEFQSRLEARAAYRPLKDAPLCDAAQTWSERLAQRDDTATAKLAELTGWNPVKLREALRRNAGAEDHSWVDELWK